MLISSGYACGKMKKYAENTPLNSELNAKEIKDHKKSKIKVPVISSFLLEI